MPKGWGAPGTATMIRDFLRISREEYPENMYRRIKESLEHQGYSSPTYKSIQNLFYVLRRLELIPFRRDEAIPHRPHLKMRRYYDLVPGREDDPAWRNPFHALWYPEKFEKETQFRLMAPTPEEWMKLIRKRKPNSLTRSRSAETI